MPPSTATEDDSSGMVPKSDIEVLSQEIGDEHGPYRIRAGHRVHYLTIFVQPTAVFNELTLCRPYLLIPELPPFPSTDWTLMTIRRGLDGKLQSFISFEPLDQVESSWHQRSVDVLSLKRLRYHKQRVHEVQFEGQAAISKIAILQWWMPQLEHETRVYEAITANQSLEQPPIAPGFLGHVTEQGRNTGFLLEKIDGQYATVANFPECEAALRRLHSMGFVHGDANRYNFIVERSSGNVRIIDFEHAEPYEETKAQLELEELKAQLDEEAGWGASAAVEAGLLG